MLVKHISNISIKKDSLWVRWIHSVRLTEHSIWIVQCNKNDSWCWKDLMSIRDLIKQHMVYNIGNGTVTSMWFDNWASIGPLIYHISYRSLYAARIDRNITVSEMIDGDRWKWPHDWNQKYPHLVNLNVPTLIEEMRDKVVWKNSDGKVVKFSTKAVWQDLCEKYDTVIWHRMVWFS